MTHGTIEIMCEHWPVVSTGDAPFGAEFWTPRWFWLGTGRPSEIWAAMREACPTATVDRVRLVAPDGEVLMTVEPEAREKDATQRAKEWVESAMEATRLHGPTEAQKAEWARQERSTWDQEESVDINRARQEAAWKRRPDESIEQKLKRGAGQVLDEAFNEKTGDAEWHLGCIEAEKSRKARLAEWEQRQRGIALLQSGGMIL